MHIGRNRNGTGDFLKKLLNRSFAANATWTDGAE